MKSIIIALSILMGLTTNLDKAFDYDKAWQEVEKLISEGLPKSALEKVNDIHKIAIVEKNDPQLVKTVIYITRLSIQTDEKGIEKSIEKLEFIVNAANAPTKQITASYLAELYQRYFDNYRYEISQRSELTGEKSTDFRTWSTQQFLSTIESWYVFSVNDKKVINIPVENFNVVLSKYDVEAISFRPTIYEVLADRAFTFFNNYSNYSNENSESFQVSEPWYFGSSEEFTNKEIPTKDKSLAHYKMLRLYQDILQTQIKYNNKQALVDYDLKRLEYVYGQSTLENKSDLYQKSLQNLAQYHAEIDYHTEIIAKLAEQQRSMADDSLANVKTLALCEAAIKKYPNSTGASKCQNIINDIKNPSLQIYAEQVYPSKNLILLALDYNNVNKVIIETVKLGKEFLDFSQRRNQDEIVDYLKNAKKVTTQNQTLKPSALWKSQRIELSNPNLPYGHYAAIVRSDDKESEIFQYVVFHVSDLAYSSYMSEGKRTFIVADRITGKSIKGADVTLSYQQYNPTSRKNENIKSNKYTTDANGKVTINGLTDKNTKVVVTYKKDILDLNQYHYNYNNYKPEAHKFAEVFTDRAIYRPGQTVYFKAILLENDERQVPSILKNNSVKVIFKDANYQEIATQTLTSNEFGSVNGSFTIPLGKLNGNFIIEITSKNGISGQKDIQVEEYKRPTFEVKSDVIIGEYKVNDQIKITGSALTLAGTNVDGAKVTYKVVRSARFPGWGWYWRMPYQSAEFIVDEGETTTDGDGKYAFEFQAIPDLKIAKKDQPVFNYTIQVDVVDQRGETRSATSYAAVSYTSFSLSSNVQKDIDIAEVKPLKITATSTNGQTIQTKGTVKISQLQEPKVVQINKYWNGKIDIPLPRSISEKYFPQYPILAERDFTSWGVAKQVYSGEFSTADSINIKSVLKAGVYKIELEAIDKFGEKVTSENYMVITDFAKGAFPKSDFLFTKVKKTILEPGEQLSISFGSNEQPITVHTIIEKDGRTLMEESQLINKKGAISLPITENHRGGIHVKTTYIIQNRTYQNDYHIDVPWTNKQLKITFETFRDKTLPGAKEEYRIKISGVKQDKVAAEMVAAMYDASLDQFVTNTWKTDFYPNSYNQLNLESPGFMMVSGQYYYYGNNNGISIKYLTYPSLLPLMDNYGYYGGGRGREVMMRNSMSNDMPLSAPMMDEMASKKGIDFDNINETAKDSSTANEVASKKDAEQPPLVRKNLKETVFFFPELKTDAEGNIILAFTINEALTKWKLMSFVHTKDFMTGYDERFVQTQKNLMVFPNAPRFVRDGDVISFSAKVSNLSETSLNGQATLQLLDAITLQDITNEVIKSPTSLNFDIEKGRSQGLAWELAIPDTKYQAITYRITAKAGDHTDGEENTIPVVTNRMLITESMPMWIKGNETKSFTFQAFKNNNSPSKKDFRYTVEYTSNPVWYAIQALPYMTTTSNISTQALVDKFYANALASKIANAHPKIKAVFDQWRTKDKDVLLSNLSKNEELKSALLEETPWVRQSLSEAEQKRNIAILFDLNKLADERAVVISKLKERQLSNGGFPWLTGGRDDVYTTQNILENIGHLYHLGALEINDPELTSLVSKALKYMDDELATRYIRLQENIKKYGGNINDDHLDDLSVHYMYVKTFFKHVNATPVSKEAREYYFGQVKKYWLKRGLYTQAMIGLILHRNDNNTVKVIIKSLREKSFSSDELGMYWNEGNGFYWHQLPIERHALMIELFSEVELKKDEADKMKIWLLKNKQTNHWKTSKSTSAAIYALLLQGESGEISQWITESVQPVITVGKEVINTDARNSEAGTGYIKKTYIADNFSKDIAAIKIKNDNTSVAWGAAYYQYFEQLDKIKTFADTPLKLNKKLYKVVASGKGDELVEITANTVLKPGDKLKVRIELIVDRQMEYVHMKDMRASGLEPTNVISEYKYQGQLGYYETTKDLATHFYFSYLPKGTFVFEYHLIVVHNGDFSGGITSIESMYAPEFSSHSEGLRVKVK